LKEEKQHINSGPAFDALIKLISLLVISIVGIFGYSFLEDSIHSPKLITQNRATRAGWKQMIDWMQETQGLQDLGEHETAILDYLAKHYAPEEEGRRRNLNMEEVEWYVLEGED